MSLFSVHCVQAEEPSNRSSGICSGFYWDRAVNRFCILFVSDKPRRIVKESHSSRSDWLLTYHGPRAHLVGFSIYWFKKGKELNKYCVKG